MSNGEELEAELVEAPEGWRVAIKAFETAEYTYGSKIPKGWFYEAFGLEEPKPQTSLKQAQETNLKFLGSFKAFQNYLLYERSMALKTIWSYGYEIVTPQEQTAWADTEMEREMKKAFAKASERLVNIDHAQLSDREIQENAKTIARTGAARALLLGRNKLPTHTLKQLIQKEPADETA